MSPMQPTKFGFGQPVLRKEDDALLRGNGRYVADHAPAGLLHATVLRSPHAHARFRVTDVAAARAMPGVRLVLTADDMARWAMFHSHTVSSVEPATRVLPLLLNATE